MLKMCPERGLLQLNHCEYFNLTYSHIDSFAVYFIVYVFVSNIKVYIFICYIYLYIFVIYMLYIFVIYVLPVKYNIYNVI